MGRGRVRGGGRGGKGWRGRGGRGGISVSEVVSSPYTNT